MQKLPHIAPSSSKTQTQQTIPKSTPSKTLHIKKAPRGRPRKPNSKQINHSQKYPSSYLHDDQETVEMIIIEFFSLIEQRDLVFDSKTRSALASLKEHRPQKYLSNEHNRQIKPQYDYDPNLELKKIQDVLTNLIFAEPKIEQVDRMIRIGRLSQFFLDTAKMFGSEVLSELYEILLTVSQIILESWANKEKMQWELRRFGNLIPSQKEKQKFFYFGFNMFELPEGKTEEDIKTLRKHRPQMRYILKQKYRKPDGPYADLIVKLGDMVGKILFQQNETQMKEE